MNQLFQYCDIYAKKITFLHKGKSSNKTTCGGLLTSLIIFGLLILYVYEFVSQKINIQSKTLYLLNAGNLYWVYNYENIQIFLNITD